MKKDIRKILYLNTKIKLEPKVFAKIMSQKSDHGIPITTSVRKAVEKYFC